MTNTSASQAKAATAETTRKTAQFEEFKIRSRSKQRAAKESTAEVSCSSSIIDVSNAAQQIGSHGDSASRRQSYRRV